MTVTRIALEMKMFLPCAAMCVFVGLFVRFASTAAVPVNPASEGPAFWRKEAAETLQRMLNTKQNTNIAKNVIFFLGDGMSVNTVTASRILKGQNQHKSGEATVLSFETFPTTGMAKTYNVDHMTPDSAGTATALLSGVKTNFGVVGVGSSAKRAKCETLAGSEVENIMDWSLKEGKSGGIVTTTRITHATPASAYAHSVERNWEGDADLPANLQGGCTDIAYQLVMDSTNINVLMGGGRYYFLPNNASDPQTGNNSAEHGRRDGLDLTKIWQEKQSKLGRQCDYVWNRDQMMQSQTDCLLGLFNPSHMSFELERNKTVEPSLTEMTEKAISVLSKNDKGYFLLVEGGRIDHGHHDGIAKMALTETVAMDMAVEKALNMTNEEDTLIIVTADHAHTMVMSGYPSRGSPILGLDDFFDESTEFQKTVDGMPMTILLYGNGPGYGRKNLTGVDTTTDYYHQQSAVNIATETHGGDDVTVFARGPMAHLLSGVYEQNYVAQVMAYASCVGANKDHCNIAPVVETTVNPCSHGTRVNASLAVLLQISTFLWCCMKQITN